MKDCSAPGTLLIVGATRVPHADTGSALWGLVEETSEDQQPSCCVLRTCRGKSVGLRDIAGVPDLVLEHSVEEVLV